MLGVYNIAGAPVPEVLCGRGVKRACVREFVTDLMWMRLNTPTHRIGFVFVRTYGGVERRAGGDCVVIPLVWGCGAKCDRGVSRVCEDARLCLFLSVRCVSVCVPERFLCSGP